MAVGLNIVVPHGREWTRGFRYFVLSPAGQILEPAREVKRDVGMDLMVNSHILWIDGIASMVITRKTYVRLETHPLGGPLVGR